MLAWSFVLGFLAVLGGVLVGLGWLVERQDRRRQLPTLHAEALQGRVEPYERVRVIYEDDYEHLSGNILLFDWEKENI